MGPFGTGRSNLVISLVASVIALAALELAAQALLRSSDRVFEHYASYSQMRARHGPPKVMPHPQIGYVTAANYVRGANRHNALGFRGDDIAPRGPRTLRIATLGGSTTYSDGVDDYRDAYPKQLELALQSKFPACDVQVINAGVPGYTSHHSRLNWTHRVRNLKPDLVLIYHGVNDLYARLVWPPERHTRNFNAVFAAYQNPAEYPAWEDIAFLRIPAVRLGLIEPHNAASRLYVFGDSMVGPQLHHQLAQRTYPSAVFVKHSVETILSRNTDAHFLANLEALVNDVHASGSESMLLSFITAPKTGTALALPEMRAALQASNVALRNLSGRLNAHFLDLSALQGRSELYTDSVHFNAKGNRLRAALAAEAIGGVNADSPRVRSRFAQSLRQCHRQPED